MIAADERHRHEEVWLNLPWLATGRLSAAERERAEAHLRHCEDCRRELALQDRLCTAFTEPDRVTYAPGPSFRKLMDRIDRSSGDRSSTPQRARQAGRSLLARLGSVPSWRPPGLAWAASFLLIFTVSGLVATAFLWTVPAFTTRTDTPPAGAPNVLHIALSRSVTLGDVEELLRASGARIVEGPDKTGVFGVTPAGRTTSGPSGAHALKALAARLGSDPRVLWVQPLSDDTTPAQERAPETREH